MPTHPREPVYLPRDGTSQKGRVLPALDPESVRIDERTVQDLVTYAREYGKGLVYHDQDDRPAGTFRDFVGSLDPDVVAAFLEHPERFDPETTPALFRPHFTLFLAFLRLYRGAQDEMNGLARRHLDFYYREVLRMGAKGPVPDRVHVLFDLARGETEVRVPEGSLVTAGPDSLGKEQLYRTEQEIVVNRVTIARKSSLLVERRRTGLAEARAQHEDDPRAAFVAMLEIAFGAPLPPYSGKEMSAAALVDLAGYVGEGGRLHLTVAEIDELARRAALPAAGMTDEQKKERQDRIDAAVALARRRWEDQGSVPPEPSEAGIVDHWKGLDLYFRMPPVAFHDVLRLLAEGPDEHGWRRITALVEAAHQRKVREDRAARLAAIHDAAPDEGLLPLIREVLGDPAAKEYDLNSYLRSDQQSALSAARQEQDWETVYGLLELVQRARLGERPAEKEEWINLHPAADAAAGGARPALDGQAGSPRWATFGLPRPAAAQTSVLGWALRSPLLHLREGVRVVTLGLTLRGAAAAARRLGDLLRCEEGPVSASHPLLFEVTTAGGWVECPQVRVGVEASPIVEAGPLSEEQCLLTLEIELTFDEAMAAIAPLPPGLADIGAGAPVLRVLLRPVPGSATGESVTCYPELSRFSLLTARLGVEVTGIAGLSLGNDDGALDAKKPFEPFGRAPVRGSRFSVGHPEIVTRKLDSLGLRFEWMGLPPDLAQHYAAYKGADKATLLVDPARLTATVSLVDRGKPRVSKAKQPLFQAPAKGAPWIDLAPDLEAAAVDTSDRDPSRWARYLQVELDDHDLGHSLYPLLATRMATALAIDIAAKKEDLDPSTYEVSPPWTPKLKRLTLDYTASQEIDLTTGPPEGVRVLHLHPFGSCDAHKDADSGYSAAGVPLLPRLDHDGELYLGLAGVSAPQNVSLLFQLAEGSADPDLPAPAVAWSYLDGDRWIPCAHRVIRDTTGGLVSSGIVEIALDPAAPSTRLPGGLYWLRAAVARDPAAVCDTVDIQPQAVSCVFVDRGNAPDHFQKPLPSGKIKKLAARIPGIAAVRQPYTSRGGRTAEDPGMWATRVSERLRHRQRAVAMWDHERLVLERFPQVYKARCLPARADEPGKVDVVVIPDIRDLLPSDPFEPAAPASLLAEIQQHLRQVAPAFAEVRVRNAAYVYVRVRLSVRFAASGNEAYHVRRLNDELNRFLSPWAYEEGSDIVLGGRIYANSIVDFVDRLEYVDYVAAVTLFRSADGVTFRPAPAPPEGEGAFVAADRPDAVLVTDRRHEIIVLREAAYDEAAMTGINFMKVDLDFQVA